MKDKIIETILGILIFTGITTVFIGICMADSASITPTAICMAAGCVLLAIANIIARGWIR